MSDVRTTDDQTQEAPLPVHSPGPWKFGLATPGFRAPTENGAADFYIEAADGIVPGIVWEFGGTGEANVRLIAAAPDLLALARKYAEECGECDGTGQHFVGESTEGPQEPCPDCADIRAVIAKAEGRS